VAPLGPGTRDEATARLEAVLFLAHEPLNTRKLARLAHLADGTEARTLIRRLNRLYDAAGSAFRAEELAGGFQLMSRPKFGSWLRRLNLPAPVRLSAPALETLAVVAYRQPVPRAEIEAIRGVDCAEILRQLMDRDLVRTAGRAGELGRPYLYATTRRFLQVFGLRHIDDLPRALALRAPDQRPGLPATLNHDPHAVAPEDAQNVNLQTTQSEVEEELERDNYPFA
jgi:segregation and condensation protein B